ncbi:MAG: ribonuclease Z [Micropruina sp.]|nr:ribonuclease Z [Micropruina sp.]
MDLLLLGTGASDGWPNAFCRCDSCLDQRSRGETRTPMSVLVDGRLLLDCGPEAPRQALRAGIDLAEVDAVLVTHAHHDHLDPSFLMHRSWVSTRPLVLAGPEPVIAGSRPWVAPDQTVIDFQTLTPGQSLTLAGYRVHTIPARHQAFGQALLYVIEGPDATVLYATDTGPWLPEALSLLAGHRLDLVLLEETFGDADSPESHHNLSSFATAVDDLRRLGCVDDTTRVVAIHLGHHNPPLPELTERLATLGAEVHPDLARLRITR